MRLGVLDVGSNTVHLLVVDAWRGGHPTPMSSTKSSLRLAESMDNSGKLTRRGADKLISTVDEFAKIAASSGCAELMAFATSALRDAKNSEDVLARVRAETGVALQVLSGVDEARLTFLAVRRWYGWSAGRITNIDIGGGSLELSSGVDEEPDVAMSFPLGAGRLTSEWLPDDPPGRRRVAMLSDWLDTELAEASRTLIKAGPPDLAVASSKTVRSLARLTGAAPSGAGPRVKRTFTATGLRQLIAFISRMTAVDRAELEGVSAERSPQMVAGALVAEASMKALSIESFDICPWALREGLILRKLDSEADGTALVEFSGGCWSGGRQTAWRRLKMTGPDNHAHPADLGRGIAGAQRRHRARRSAVGGDAVAATLTRSRSPNSPGTSRWCAREKWRYDDEPGVAEAPATTNGTVGSAAGAAPLRGSDVSAEEMLPDPGYAEPTPMTRPPSSPRSWTSTRMTSRTSRNTTSCRPTFMQCASRCSAAGRGRPGREDRTGAPRSAVRCGRRGPRRDHDEHAGRLNHRSACSRSAAVR